MNGYRSLYMKEGFLQYLTINDITDIETTSVGIDDVILPELVAESVYAEAIESISKSEIFVLITNRYINNEIMLQRLVPNSDIFYFRDLNRIYKSEEGIFNFLASKLNKHI